MRKLVLVFFLIDAAACAVITPWMGVMMRIRFNELLDAGQIAPSPLDWISPIVWGSYGPAALIVAIIVIKRGWKKTD